MSNTSILSRRSTPVYTIESISEFPINPYREFVYYCANTLYPIMDNKISMSLKEFNKISFEKQKEILTTAIGNIPGMNIVFLEKSSHKRIFIEALLSYKGVRIGVLQMFTHLTYLGDLSSNNSFSKRKELDEEFVAVELNFKDFDGFDFMNLNRDDNILDFSKDDTDTETFDMLIAHIRGLAEFTEFVKVYKAKSLIIKNIDLFSNKFIKPYVNDMQNAYSPEHFLIGVICGENIHKMTYPYENYLASIKQFADAIKERYGDKYFSAKEDNDNSGLSKKFS